MTTRVAIAVLAVLICRPMTSVVTAQERAPKPTAAATVTALMIDVTISRHLGDKPISSTPYQLSVIPDLRASLRMGGEVPVPSVTFTPANKEDGGKATNPLTSFSYRSVGTFIDVLAGVPADGQYRLTLTIEESSIYPPDLAPPSTKALGVSAFRSFKSNTTIALRDGQSLSYTMATDRISGEVYRVSVKLTVVK